MSKNPVNIGLHEGVYTYGTVDLPPRSLHILQLAIEHEEKSLKIVDFAKLLNIKRQSLNRTINKLEEDGLILRENHGVFTSLRVPDPVKNVLKIGGVLLHQGFTRYQYIDDFELSVNYSIHPMYVPFFNENEFWNMTEGDGKHKGVYRGVYIIKGNTDENGKGRMILRKTGKTYGKSKDEILGKLQDNILLVLENLKERFRTLEFEPRNKIAKIEYEIADPASTALYNVLGKGEHTLLRDKDDKPSFQVHKSLSPERVYPNAGDFDTTSEKLEKRLFRPILNGELPTQVKEELDNMTTDQNKKFQVVGEYLQGIKSTTQKDIEKIRQDNEEGLRAFGQHIMGTRGMVEQVVVANERLLETQNHMLKLLEEYEYNRFTNRIIRLFKRFKFW